MSGLFAPKLPRQLEADLKLVAQYYECPADEVDVMRKLALADPEAAAVSYSEMAAICRLAIRHATPLV